MPALTFAPSGEETRRQDSQVDLAPIPDLRLLIPLWYGDLEDFGDTLTLAREFVRCTQAVKLFRAAFYLRDLKIRLLEATGTIDHQRAYINLVLDNFSRCILGWRVAKKLRAATTLELLREL